MAHPVVEFSDVTHEYAATAKSSWSYTMPATINVGDILFLAVVSHRVRETYDVNDDSASGTWTKQTEGTWFYTGPPFHPGTSYWAKVANGDEGSKTLSWTTVAAGTTTPATVDLQAYAFYRISGVPTGLSGIAYGTITESSVAVSSIDVAPVTPSWPNKQTLFIAITGVEDYNRGGAYPTTYPFSNNQAESHETTSIANNVSIGACTKNGYGGEDPGSFDNFDGTTPTTSDISVDCTSIVFAFEGTLPAGIYVERYFPGASF